MSEQQVHTVMADVGEYEDREEYPVRAFLDEAEAEEFVALANGSAKERLEQWRQNPYKRPPQNPYDPECDHLNAEYRVVSVPLGTPK